MSRAIVNTRKASGGFYVKTQNRLAVLFSVSPATIVNWVDAGAPAAGRNGFDLREWIDWRIKRVAQPPDVAAVTRELREAQRDLARERLGRERLKVVPVEDVESERVARMRWFTGCMSRAAGELAGKLTGRAPGETRKIVSDYFDAVRREACRQHGPRKADMKP